MGKAHVVGRHWATPAGLISVALNAAKRRTDSALARLEPAICLVDHIGAPATTDHAIVAVPIFQGLQGVANLHGVWLCLREFASAAPRQAGW